MSTPVGQSRLDEANLLPYRSGSKQTLSLSFKAIFFIEGSIVDIVDHDPRSNGSCGGSDGRTHRRRQC